MGTIIHPDLEVGIIDKDLLKKVFDELAPPGEAGRIARTEGIPDEEVESIRLEFLNILKIDHLWMYTGLTKLSLANNSIEKIENLEPLVNLRELNLAFNYITCIENLSELVNLEILSLYSNQITKIEQMDSLQKLIIFSIGRNRIDDKQSIFYLREFDNLTSVNMAENPICERIDNFRLFIAAFLPKITYYEYAMLMKDEREKACEYFKKELNEVLDSEKERNAIKEKLAADAAEEALYADSFVEYLGNRSLFDNMFAKDTEGKTLLLMGDQASEAFNEYEKKFIGATRNLFEIGQQKYKIRKQEVDQFFKCVEGAKLEGQEKSQRVMEQFMEKKLQGLLVIRKLQQEVEEDLSEPGSPEHEALVAYLKDTTDKLTEEFNELYQITWRKLMGYELILFEQLEEVNEQFGLVVTEMINSFIEVAQGVFTECRGYEVEYLDKINELAQDCLASHHNTEIIFNIPKELEKIMVDKDNLMNALSASHDAHMLVIDEREDRLVSRASLWLKNLVNDLQKNEVIRDRAQVLEINHFLDIQKEEFEEMVASVMTEPELDPDVADVLTE